MQDASIFADNAAFVASKIVRQDYPLPNGFDPLVPLSQEPGPHLRRFKTVSPSLMEMILIRLADNFTTYLLDIVGECIRSRPGLLKSSKDQMTTEAILAFTTLEECAPRLEAKGTEGQAGRSSSLDFEHLGVANMTQQGFFPSLVELVEARNCMVHNRAKNRSQISQGTCSVRHTSQRGAGAPALNR